MEKENGDGNRNEEIKVEGQKTTRGTVTNMVSREQLSLFRQRYRRLLARIKETHGENTLIHLFPATPVSVAVEMGRVWMPKADLPIRIYDENPKTGGFSKIFDITNH